MLDYDISQENKNANREAAFLIRSNKIDDAIAILDLQIAVAEKELAGAMSAFFDASNDFEYYIYTNDIDIEDKDKIPVCLCMWPLYCNLSMLLIRKKMYDDAKQAIDMALNLNPIACDPYFNLFEIYLRKKDYDAALECLKKLKELVYSLNDVAKYYHAWGQYFRANGKLFEASMAYTASLPYDLDDEITRDIINRIISECIDKKLNLSNANLNLDSFGVVVNPSDFDMIRKALDGSCVALKSENFELALFLLTVYNTIAQRDDIGDFIRELNEHMSQF